MSQRMVVRIALLWKFKRCKVHYWAALVDWDSELKCSCSVLLMHIPCRSGHQQIVNHEIDEQLINSKSLQGFSWSILDVKGEWPCSRSKNGMPTSNWVQNSVNCCFEVRFRNCQSSSLILTTKLLLTSELLQIGKQGQRPWTPMILSWVTRTDIHSMVHVYQWWMWCCMSTIEMPPGQHMPLLPALNVVPCHLWDLASCGMSLYVKWKRKVNLKHYRWRAFCQCYHSFIQRATSFDQILRTGVVKTWVFPQNRYLLY